MKKLLKIIAKIIVSIQNFLGCMVIIGAYGFLVYKLFFAQTIPGQILAGVLLFIYLGIPLFMVCFFFLEKPENK